MEKIVAIKSINKNILQHDKTVATNKRKIFQLKDLLLDIVVTAPVFQFEMSELKAELT